MQKPLGWHRVERGVERWVGDKTFFWHSWSFCVYSLNLFSICLSLKKRGNACICLLVCKLRVVCPIKISPLLLTFKTFFLYFVFFWHRFLHYVCRSEEWSKVSESQKKDLGITIDDNGEFWYGIMTSMRYELLYRIVTPWITNEKHAAFVLMENNYIFRLQHTSN